MLRYLAHVNLLLFIPSSRLFHFVFSMNFWHLKKTTDKKPHKVQLVKQGVLLMRNRFQNKQNSLHSYFTDFFTSSFKQEMLFKGGGKRKDNEETFSGNPDTSTCCHLTPFLSLSNVFLDCFCLPPVPPVFPGSWFWPLLLH